MARWEEPSIGDGVGWAARSGVLVGPEATASSHSGISVLPLSKSRASRVSAANIARGQSLLSDLALMRP
jgi:hypothetical protein